MTSHFMRLLFVACVIVSFEGAIAIGVNYGQVANNLPAPEEVVALIDSTILNQLKLYGADPSVLTAFANTGIDIVIGAGNDQITPLATTDGFALKWVQNNIVAYPNTSIVGVVLGNEVLSYAVKLAPLLLPAMQNLHTALVSVGLDSKVKISTPNSMGILARSFPPSAGIFHYSYSVLLTPMLQFLNQTGSSFMVNVYPYFAYAQAPANVSLNFTLFQATDPEIVHDRHTGLNYTNMFDAQVDAINAALAASGFDNVSVTVTETGWPSAGDPSEVGATLSNAQIFNGNLIQHIVSGTGTPAKPGVPIDTYIFALYNEDLKPGPTSERNFGLFQPNGATVYNAGLLSASRSASPPPPLSPWSAPPPTSPSTSPASPSSPPPLSFPTPPPSPVSLPSPVSFPPPPPSPVPPPSPLPPFTGSPPPSPPPTILPSNTPPATPPPYAKAWCVAKSGANVDMLQAGLDYACGAGANCDAIQVNGTCFLPNTVVSHASYAFDSYYRVNGENYWNCFFNNSSELAFTDPSSNGCEYP